MKPYRHLLIIILIFFVVSISQAQEVPGGAEPLESSLSVTSNAKPVANTLYGHSFASPSSLYTIDRTNGAATIVGSIGYSGITDVAFKDTTLFGITFSTFVGINPETGAGSYIGHLGYSGMNALAVSDSGVFYAANTSGTFINVDEETGKGTYIGRFGDGLTSSGDLAFAKDGTLYAAINKSGDSTDWLATINLQTGAASLKGDIGYSGVWGLSFHNDQLIGVTSGGNVLEIDLESGAGSEINDTNIRFGGLTTSPDAIPMFELPYDYSGSTFVDESRDTQKDGSVNSYFDHQYPTYCGEPNTGGCLSSDYRAVNFHGYDGGQLTNNTPPYNVTYNGHDGIDFAVSGANVKVLAAASGTVIDRGNDAGVGNYVSIEHNGGYITKYYHLDSIAPGIGIGSTVTRSSIDDSNAYIGIMGDTGDYSEGAHIHFMVLNPDGIVVDPYGWSPKVDSAWYGKEDPWAKHNREMEQPKDAESHYLWLHPLGSTKVTNPAIDTTITSPTDDVQITFLAGAADIPLRIEFAENLNPVLVDGLKAERSFYVMAFQNDVDPVIELDGSILVEFQPAAEQMLVLSEHVASNTGESNMQLVVWDTHSASWQELDSTWDDSAGVLRATTSQLGTFAVTDTKRVFLPLVLNP